MHAFALQHAQVDLTDAWPALTWHFGALLLLLMQKQTAKRTHECNANSMGREAHVALPSLFNIFSACRTSSSGTPSSSAHKL